jgi:GNAT superfamily N-acetyltransferase
MLDGVASGTFRLLETDERVWPEAAPGEALYLHSLAVCRSAAGSGLALQMLDWARARARERGCSELRLDCWAGNERLKRYYLEAGFEPRGDITLAFDGRAFNSSRFARRA